MAASDILRLGERSVAVVQEHGTAPSIVQRHREIQRELSERAAN